MLLPSCSECAGHLVAFTGPASGSLVTLALSRVISDVGSHWHQHFGSIQS